MSDLKINQLPPNGPLAVTDLFVIEQSTGTVKVDLQQLINLFSSGVNMTAVNAAIATAIANLVNSAPGTLDTLKELADALGDDPNFSTTITNLIAAREVLANKATNLSSNDDTHYPTVKAVVTAINAIPGAVFSSGFIVNLPVNNTGIPNGTVVNIGDPMSPFLKSAFSQASPTTVAVNTDGNSQPYNQTGITLNVAIGYTINTSGATLANIKLERSRDNATWTTLLNTATATTTYNDAGLNATVDNRPIYYKLTVTDSAGGTNNATRMVSFAAYAAPGMAFAIGSTTRERGDISTSITGTITRNSPNIALTSYQVQYQVNGTGAWNNIGSPVTASGSSQAISVTHNDSSLNTSTSLNYRVQVIDAQQTTTSATQTISFIYRLWYDTVASVPANSAAVRALTNTQLTNSGNTFTLLTGTVNQNFVIVLPPGKSLVSVINTDALGANITTEFASSSISVNDFGGTAVTCTLLTKTTSIPYSPSNHFVITIA